MMKKILAGLLCALLASAPAFAEAYTGTIAARSTLTVSSGAGGVIEEMYIEPGSTVEAGDAIAQMRTRKVFASQDGTIARIHAQTGGDVDGAVLELSPVSRYTIHCTADQAYDSIQSNLVHCGETLYLCCTYNGTHRGKGSVYAIDDETYMVQATGGEFYVGETVYLYRDADYSYKQRVGIGTVVSSATETYQDEGRIVQMHVAEGEYVQRGELLYEIIEGDVATIAAPAAGVITACDAAPGDTIQEGQALAVLAPWDEICVRVQVDEEQAGRIAPGDDAALAFACDADERLVPGRVMEISQLAQDGSYTVYIAADELPMQLGMSVNVRMG